jgi:hypothetical protein
MRRALERSLLEQRSPRRGEGVRQPPAREGSEADMRRALQESLEEDQLRRCGRAPLFPPRMPQLIFRPQFVQIDGSMDVRLTHFLSGAPVGMDAWVMNKLEMPACSEPPSGDALREDIGDRPIPAAAILLLHRCRRVTARIMWN